MIGRMHNPWLVERSYDRYVFVFLKIQGLLVMFDCMIFF